MLNKILISILAASGIAFASTRIIDVDQMRSSDRTKTWSLPAASDTLLGRDSTDTLTNKSMSGAANTFTNMPAGTMLTGQVPAANGGSGIANSGTFTWGSNNITFTTAGATGVTLPTSGTLATLAGAEALTNKTIAAGSNTISGLTDSNLSGTAAIANANLATMADGSIKSNISGGSAVPANNTLTAILDYLFSSTHGALLYRGSSAWQALAPGTGFLQGQGSGVNLQWGTPSVTYLKGYINGVTTQVVSTVTNRVYVSSGMAVNSTAADTMTLASTLDKNLFAAWSVGSGNGCLDTGSTAPLTWYWIYLIKRTDTSVVDVLCSTSAGAPTLPANYTEFRRIGAVFTQNSSLSSAILPFVQFGDNWVWLSPIQNVNTASCSTATSSAGLSVPPTRVRAQITATVSISGGTPFLFIKSPDQVAWATNAVAQGPASSINGFASILQPTDANKSFDYKCSTSGVSVTIDTYGYFMDRRDL